MESTFLVHRTSKVRAWQLTCFLRRTLPCNVRMASSSHSFYSKVDSSCPRDRWSEGVEVRVISRKMGFAGQPAISGCTGSIALTECWFWITIVGGSGLFSCGGCKRPSSGEDTASRELAMTIFHAGWSTQ